MDLDDLRRSMEEQAAAVGLKFEEGLVPEILVELDGEPGRMPLLQHTLRELWNRRRGVWLKRTEYDALGGVHQAIARTADDFLKDPKHPVDHCRAMDLLSRMVRVADESDAANETRRRVRIDELIPAGEPAEPTRALLTRLANEYLVITAGPEAEVAHEALIRHWDTLRFWIREHRPDLLVRQSLATDTQAWSRRGRPSDALRHRGGDLDRAEALKCLAAVQLNQAEVDYLSACRGSQWRARVGRRFSLAAAIVIPLGIAAGSYQFARVQNRYAEDQRKARETTETTAAEGFFRAITGESGPLNEREVEAFEQLGGLKAEQDGIRIKFLVHALSNASRTHRLVSRLPVAIQAAIGLDPRRREKILEVLKHKLGDRNAPVPFQVCLADAVTELDSSDPSMNEVSLRILLQAYANSDKTLGPGSEKLGADVANRLVKVMETQPADRQGWVADSVADALRGEFETYPHCELAVAKIAKALPPERAANLIGPSARALADALAKEAANPHASGYVDYRFNFLTPLAEALVASANALPLERAASLIDASARTLADALAKSTNWLVWRHFAAALEILAQALPEEGASNSPDSPGRTLADALAKEANPSKRRNLAWALAASAKAMPPERAANLIGPLSRMLGDALAEAVDPSARRDLAYALTDLAAALPPEQAANLLDCRARTLADVLIKQTDPSSRSNLAEHLAKSARAMPTDRAASLIVSVARAVADAYAKEPQPSAHHDWARSLAALAKAMPPEQAVNVLADALATETDQLTRSTLTEALGASVKALPLERAADVIADAISREFNSYALLFLAKALADLTNAMPSERAADLLDSPVRMLVDALGRQADGILYEHMAGYLAASAKALPPKRAAELLDSPARALADAFAKEAKPNMGSVIAAALAALVKALPPDRAADLVRSPARALAKQAVQGQSYDTHVLADLAEALPPDRAAELLGSPTRMLADALAKEANPDSRLGLARALAALAMELPPDRAADMLIDSTGRYPAQSSVSWIAENGQAFGDILSSIRGLADRASLEQQVEWLKHPFCHGGARRAILSRIKPLQGMTFRSHWELVEWLQKHRPDIDLTSPPTVDLDRSSQ
jgi:hypothetical protein